MKVQRGPAGARGFTLLEVLVSFTVFALTAGVLMQGLSTSLRAGAAATTTHRATALAESKLAEVASTPADVLGLREGSFSGADTGFTWQSEVAAVDAGDPDSTLPVRLYQVQVVVNWRAAGKERSVRLETLALAVAG